MFRGQQNKVIENIDWRTNFWDKSAHEAGYFCISISWRYLITNSFSEIFLKFILQSFCFIAVVPYLNDSRLRTSLIRRKLTRWDFHTIGSMMKIISIILLSSYYIEYSLLIRCGSVSLLTVLKYIYRQLLFDVLQ